MSDALVLALDVGTSSLRTALYDGRARRLTTSTAQQSYRLRTHQPGMAELAPGALLQAARQCLAHTLDWRRGHARYRKLTVAAVGMSCFWHSLMGVDRDGRALTPIYTWADARCQSAAAALRSDLDQSQVHARTGCMLHSSFWPAKLQWLKASDPSGFAKVAYWLSPGEWLYWRLAGVRACAHGMATGTGLYDPSLSSWDEPMLAYLGLDPAKLQPLCDQPLEPVRVARDMPELGNASWCASIGDGAAGNLGSGADRHGTLAINLGSSAAVREVRSGREAKAPLGLFAYRLDSSRFLLGGAISNSGNLRQWCRRELRLDEDEATLERKLARRVEPVEGLTVLPFWTAERAPTWRDDMRGVVFGMTQATEAIDVLQASVEAGFHRLAQIIERMNVGSDARLVVSGGGSRGRANQQRLANVLGRQISVCAESEASARGAAVRALELLGLSPPPPKLSAAISPDARVAALFAQARDAQASLESRLYPDESA